MCRDKSTVSPPAFRRASPPEQDSEWRTTGAHAIPNGYLVGRSRAGPGQQTDLGRCDCERPEWVSALVVFALFVWAARKDGEYDRSVQQRLGIRRKTRL